MRKLLRDGNVIHVSIVQGELRIVVDITHPPWSILGIQTLQMLTKHLQDMGEDTESFESIISLLMADERKLQ